MEPQTISTKTAVTALLTAATQGLRLVGVSDEVVNTITSIGIALIGFFLRDSNSKIEKKLDIVIQQNMSKADPTQ
jgi:hypothetical protein